MALACVDCKTPLLKAARGRPRLRCTACQRVRSRHPAQQPRPDRPCRGCGCQVAQPRRGAPKTMCNQCRRGRKLWPKHLTTYDLACNWCGQPFTTQCRLQKYCGRQCACHASRRRTVTPCANPSCFHVVLTCEAKAARGAIYCCRQCCATSKKRALATCQNASCAKMFQPKRRADPHGWRGINKYCSRECYYDARFGDARPRNRCSQHAISMASQQALATGLRKKCKMLGVAFDPRCTRLAVLERDRWICQQCGIKCNREYRLDPLTLAKDPANAEHDHIIALAIPGSPGNVLSNSQCLCSACNRRKGKSASGQLRLPLETREWASEVRGRSRANSKSCAEIPAAGV